MTLVSFDGARLALATWIPAGPRAPWAAIVALHGMNDDKNAFHLVRAILGARQGDRHLRLRPARVRALAWTRTGRARRR